MRHYLLAVGTLLLVLTSSMPGYSQGVVCPAGGSWCGPGRGCCPPGTKCSPKAGCEGSLQQVGPRCGSGYCRPGFHCVFDQADGRTAAQRCQQD